MLWLSNINWHNLIVPDVSPIEIFLRGSTVYIGTFIILRVVLKRESGGFSTTDLIVIVFIADAAQNAMAGSYQSVPDGLVLISTLVFWAWFFDWAAYHVPRIERWMIPPPLPLVKDGVLLRRNLHHEYVTISELLTKLREQGFENVEDVRLAYLEGDGRISILPFDPDRRRSGSGDSRRLY